MTPRTSAGVTLIELLVALTLLGLLAGIAGLTFHTLPATPVLGANAARVVAARDSALRTGYAVSVTLLVAGRAYDATAFPDGRVLTEAPIGVDPLTGMVRGDTR
jgi:prepilin-type N-terminal cleavage/methylation domain-containing protein